jgi:hypothetical protein
MSKACQYLVAGILLLAIVATGAFLFFDGKLFAFASSPLGIVVAFVVVLIGLHLALECLHSRAVERVRTAVGSRRRNIAGAKAAVRPPRATADPAGNWSARNMAAAHRPTRTR